VLTNVQTIIGPLLASVVKMGDMPIPVAACDLEALYRLLGHEWLVDDDREIDAMALEALCKAAQRIAELDGALSYSCDALQSVQDGASRTYKARNGREMGIQADDGEACDIIHSDITYQCGRTLDASRAVLSRQRAGQP
jgi:hypothetical protein